MGEAFDKLNGLRWKSQVKIDLAGAKAFGKSTMLEFISKHDKSINAVEGDIMTILAIAIHEKASETIRLDEFAKSEPSPWVTYAGKNKEKAEFMSQLPNLEYFNLWTTFHGSPHRFLRLVVVPDYQQYVERYKLRTSVMLKTGPAAFRTHVRQEHKVLSFPDFVQEVEDTRASGCPNFNLVNLGSDSLILAQWKDAKAIAISLAKTSSSKQMQ